MTVLSSMAGLRVRLWFFVAAHPPSASPFFAPAKKEPRPGPRKKSGLDPGRPGREKNPPCFLARPPSRERLFFLPVANKSQAGSGLLGSRSGRLSMFRIAIPHIFLTESFRNPRPAGQNARPIWKINYRPRKNPVSAGIAKRLRPLISVCSMEINEDHALGSAIRMEINENHALEQHSA